MPLYYFLLIIAFLVVMKEYQIFLLLFKHLLQLYKNNNMKYIPLYYTIIQDLCFYFAYIYLHPIAFSFFNKFNLLFLIKLIL